jgi:hypothetical protein
MHTFKLETESGDFVSGFEWRVGVELGAVAYLLVCDENKPATSHLE